MIGVFDFLSDNDDSQMANGTRSRRKELGCWPYVLPYVAFLLLVQLRGTTFGIPATLGGLVEAIVPLAMIVYFFSVEAYPELQRPRSISPLLLADVLLGILSGVAWMLPFVLVPSLQPTAPEGGLIGPQSTAADWLARGLTMVVAVPLLEELFVRSFVMRWAEVMGTDRSFRTVPIASYTLRSFLITVVIFTTAHQTWEWWVAVPWIIATNFWFYYRKSLGSVILVHAFANLTLLLAVLLASRFLTDANGQAVSLWFFV